MIAIVVVVVMVIVVVQTCHFDLMHNLNECEKKSEYTEKNLNLTIQFSTFI